jgi:DNA repair exonuclease SbcCD ATPase subunit
MPLDLQTDDHMRTDQEAWQELNEERRSMIQALKNGDFEGEREAEELSERLMRTLKSRGEDITEDVDDAVAGLKQELQAVRQNLSEGEEAVEELQETEPIWYRIKSYLEFIYENQPDPRLVVDGGEPGRAFPRDMNLPGGTYDYNMKKMVQDLGNFYQNHLSPVMGTIQDSVDVDIDPSSGEPVYSDASSMMEQLSQSAKETVRAHQFLNEYKQILELALEDEELRRRVAEKNGLGRFQRRIREDEAGFEEFEQRIEEVEEKERRIVELLQETHEVLEQKLKMDEQVIEEVTEMFSIKEGESAGGIISRFTGGESEAKLESEKFEEIYEYYVNEIKVEEEEQEGLGSSIMGRIPTGGAEEPEETEEQREEEYAELLELLEEAEQIMVDQVLPAAYRIQEEEEMDEKLNRRLIEELEEYIEEHQHLFEESDEEVEAEAERAAAEDEQELEEQDVGEVIQGIQFGVSESAMEQYRGENRAPPGSSEDPRWRIFHQNLTELLEMKREGFFEDIREEIQEIEEGYENVYRIENGEENVIEDFTGEIEDVRRDMEDLMMRIEDLEEHRMEDLRQSDTWDRDIQAIVEDIQDAQEDLERVRADLMKTQKFGNQEESSFSLIQTRIEEVMEQTEEVRETLNTLNSVISRLKDENVGEHGAREYADALMLSAVEIYEEEPREALKDELLREVSEIKEVLFEIGEVESELMQKDHKEIEIEQEEIEEIYTLVEQIKGKDGVFTELKNTINPKEVEDIDKHVDYEVASAITGISNNLDRIADLLKEEVIEEEKVVVKKAREDEAELEQADEVVEEASQGAAGLADTIRAELEKGNNPTRNKKDIGDVLSDDKAALDDPRCPLCDLTYKGDPDEWEHLERHWENYCPKDMERIRAFENGDLDTSDFESER